MNKAFDLFSDVREDGTKFFYIELPYGPDALKTGGFLADDEGNLIDMEGN